MKAKTKNLFDKAHAAIEALNSDTSCSQKDTLHALLELRDGLTMKIDALERTIEDEPEED